MQSGSPRLEAPLDETNALADEQAKKAEDKDPEHHPRRVQELPLEADVEADADVRGEELGAHDADQCATCTDTDAGEDERDGARQHNGPEREPGRPAE